MSAVRLFVLGVVRREQQAHGYKVYRELVEWQADKWTSLKPGSIYHALGQLEKQHFLRAVGVQNSQEGPSRTVYELTAAGEAEFIKLVKAALQNDDMNIELFAAGLAFMQELPRAEVLSLLKVRRQTIAGIADFMHTLPTSDSPPNPSEHPVLVGLWSGFFNQLGSHLDSLIQDVEAGRYTFSGV